MASISTSGATKKTPSSRTYGPSSRARAPRVTGLAAEELRGHAGHEQVRHQGRRAGERGDLVAGLAAEADAVHDHQAHAARVQCFGGAPDRGGIVLLVG